MKRDLALVIDKAVSYDQVAKIAQGQKWDAYKGFELFDIFESEKLGADKKSMALSFIFQLNDRTLTDEEVDDMMKKLIQQYEKEIGATIRL
ncbi:Phenylalanine--tRNA ligase beta subunit [compost metagenome]